MWCAISTPVFYPPSAPSPCLSDVNNKRIPSRPIPSRRGCSDCGELLQKSDEPTAWLSLERHWHRTALLQERPSTQEPLQITILPIHHPGVKPSTSSYSVCYICWTRQVFLYTRPWHKWLNKQKPQLWLNVLTASQSTAVYPAWGSFAQYWFRFRLFECRVSREEDLLQ